MCIFVNAFRVVKSKIVILHGGSGKKREASQKDKVVERVQLTLASGVELLLKQPLLSRMVSGEPCALCDILNRRHNYERTAGK